MSDITAVDEVVTTTARGAISSIVVVVSSLVAMVWMSWELTVVSVAVIPLFVVLAHRAGRRGQRRWARAGSPSRADDDTLERLSVSGVILAKIFGRDRDDIERLRAENLRFTDLQTAAPVRVEDGSRAVDPEAALRTILAEEQATGFASREAHLLVGPFLEPLLLRVRVRDDDSFASLARTVRSRFSDAVAHCSLWFVEIAGLAAQTPAAPAQLIPFSVRAPFKTNERAIGATALEPVHAAAGEAIALASAGVDFGFSPERRSIEAAYCAPLVPAGTARALHAETVAALERGSRSPDRPLGNGVPARGAGCGREHEAVA